MLFDTNQYSKLFSLIFMILWLCKFQDQRWRCCWN